MPKALAITGERLMMGRVQADPSVPMRVLFGLGVRDWLTALAWGGGLFATSHLDDIFAPDSPANSWAFVAWFVPFLVVFSVMILAGLRADRRSGEAPLQRGTLGQRRSTAALGLYFAMEFLSIVWIVVARLWG